MLGETAAEADVIALRTRLGLDRPLLEQYGGFLSRAVRGDLGTSLRTSEPVAQAIIDRLPATLELAAAAMLVAIVVSIPLGIIAAVRRGTAVDYAATTLALTGVSIPNFWLGPCSPSCSPWNLAGCQSPAAARWRTWYSRPFRWVQHWPQSWRG